MKRIYSLLLMLVLTLSAKQMSAQCTALFSYTQSINGLVYFADISGGSPQWWNWDFGEPQSGNSNFSYIQYPGHTYQSNGNYTVSLMVGFSNSCTATYTAVVNVNSSPCNLPLYANYTSTTGMNGSFSVTSVTTGTTGAATYSYSWGDGTGATGANTTHVYSSNGAYNVVLFVTDGACTDSVDQNVWISTVGCSLVPGYASQSQLGGTYDFSSTSTGTVPGMYYYWNFGDGSYMGTNTYSISHNYLNNGTYTVNMFATTPGSCSANYSNVVTVTNATCNLNVSFTSTNVTQSYTLASTSTGTNLGTTYSWIFGDGGTANTPNAIHNYTTNGTYTMYLLVSNGGNCTDSAAQAVTISNVCNLTTSIGSWAQNGNYNFAAIPQYSNQAYTYNWNFGNGTTGNNYYGSAQYTATGTYTVLLTVTDPNIFPVCTATAMAVINVTCPLGNGFTHTVLPGGVVNFASNATGTTMNTTYTWDYGDGTTGSGPTSSHTYSNGGAHQPALFLYDSPNCVDSLWDSVNVNTIPCISNSNFTVIYSGTPLYWNAVPAYFGNVQYAVWSWGDGNFDYTLYPSHTYSAAGLYNVCLTVYTSCGSSTTCMNYNIYKMSAPVNVDQQMVHISVIPNTAVGLKKLTVENAMVSIYPIPSNGKIELKVSDLLSSSKVANAEVIDMLGREVYREEIQVSNGRIDTALDLGPLNNGTYFIKVRSSERTYTSKIVINH
jgi:PKD repeat protein